MMTLLSRLNGSDSDFIFLTEKTRIFDGIFDLECFRTGSNILDINIFFQMMKLVVLLGTLILASALFENTEV